MKIPPQGSVRCLKLASKAEISWWRVLAESWGRANLTSQSLFVPKWQRNQKPEMKKTQIFG